jgi:hypothetical protein
MKSLVSKSSIIFPLLLAVCGLGGQALAQFAAPTAHASPNSHRHASAVSPAGNSALIWLEQIVTGNDATTYSFFGESVAVSGNTAFVGSAETNAVYVFTRENGVWTQTQKLTPSDGEEGDQFGHSVAFGNNVVFVGAYYATIDGSPKQGAVYVFAKSDEGDWIQTQKLAEGNGATNDEFGGDLSTDGSYVLVGAYGASPSTAYVFSESNGTWSQTAEFTNPDPQDYGGFAKTVALSGNYAFIGAPTTDVQQENDFCGVVHVYEESGGTWSHIQKLTVADCDDGTDGQDGANFGSAISVYGATAMIGAPHSYAGTEFPGSAYVFQKQNDGTWLQTQRLICDQCTQGDVFGGGIALSGNKAVIGARGSLFTDKTPAVYMYNESNGSWSQSARLAASDGPGTFFGSAAMAFDGSTALIGDTNMTVHGRLFEGEAYFYGASDLGLVVSAPQSVGHGEQYTSQTIATNGSSAASPAVTATVSVPAAASFVSATATQGSCDENSGVVTCDFGQIEGNAGTATVNVTLKAIGSAGTTIENTASIAKATPALTASAPTTIGEENNCEPGYTEFDGHLGAGEQFLSDPITVNEAGQKYVDLTAPTSFKFVGVTQTRYGEHTYTYRKHHGHRWGAAGSYQVGVEAGDTGGDYTLCVQLNP